MELANHFLLESCPKYIENSNRPYDFCAVVYRSANYGLQAKSRELPVFIQPQAKNTFYIFKWV